MAVSGTYQTAFQRRRAAPTRKPGNWKLAYADFLTALCAFFLVMWIINGVSAAEKAELAEQFQDASQKAEAQSAAMTSSLADEIAADLKALPAFNAYGVNMRISADGNTVRIELIDHAERPLFEVGEGRLNQNGDALVRIAGLAISYLPFPILIEGHTDSAPSLTPNYSNWELSADRANSARRILMDSGVNAGRIRAVSGLAATRPIQADNPHLPVNRRISIIIFVESDVPD